MLLITVSSIPRRSLTVLSSLVLPYFTFWKSIALPLVVRRVLVAVVCVLAPVPSRRTT
ncbi:uncharacterized protein SCHCODRAFT_02608442 [Schizophyllum commune H4-8]|uniref:uncharacterized protein n=1 Tax=Schizophyllum commune (strain H4-8 / FGSC 9210) TaxID=578458 RepID=UPI00215DF04E|nr:uncharacterized protein SCHCODRAFT_02608442 [Schizophyllum commune H4-8]KAI5900636.1 hypothetical protein SCHCODRAFT_02608442 [Schizophyllum commune H4-8]